MNRFLTKQEQLVLCVIVGLLLTGLAVKTWRLSQTKTVKPEVAQQTERAK